MSSGLRYGTQCRRPAAGHHQGVERHDPGTGQAAPCSETTSLPAGDVSEYEDKIQTQADVIEQLQEHTVLVSGWDSIYRRLIT